MCNVQARIPAHAINLDELPAILQGRQVVLSRNGLEHEPSKLCRPDGGPLIGVFPIKSVQGNPMLNKQGDALPYRFGMWRHFYVHTGLVWECESRSLPVPRLTELARDGTNFLYQLPTDIALSLWRNWPSGFSRGRNSGESLWFDALFELSSQVNPGSPLHSERYAWIGNVSIQLLGDGLFPRLPNYISSKSHTPLRHESGYPVAYYAKLEDTARASVAAIEEILERETTATNTRQGTRPSAAITSLATSNNNQTMSATKRDKVFISYSHKDQKFVDELLAHLKPLERAGRVSAWSDRRFGTR